MLFHAGFRFKGLVCLEMAVRAIALVARTAHGHHIADRDRSAHIAEERFPLPLTQRMRASFSARMMSASGAQVLTFALSPRPEIDSPPTFFRNLQTAPPSRRPLPLRE